MGISRNLQKDWIMTPREQNRPQTGRGIACLRALDDLCIRAA